ncbi:Protein kinase and PP2C-like domain-containing protein [Hibiscus syriacus]|uniref:Protein kinase and PP2C-like domain-containing protein n=1 Tax=Hibiscus syriacus TaxID=106335 RepID=A0A6A2YYT6_HIBSY|nr:Protein kinase and PP2C-like domain-containing protein [Hibiscus syriacus]
MGLDIVEPNTCVRGCCSSNSIPLHLPPSFTLLSPISRGAESVDYEAILDGKRVAARKPILSTSEELDKFHKESQLLCQLDHPGIATLSIRRISEESLSRIGDHQVSQQVVFTQKNTVGTLIYMAPEILMKEIHTEKSDVYSFGVSIHELLTGIVPYTDIRAEAQAHTVLEMNYTEQQLTAAVSSGGLRPVLAGIDSGMPASMLSLIQKCWDANPQNRPSFDDIMLELDGIQQQRKKMGKEDFSLQLSSVSQGHQVIDSVKNLHTYQEKINWSTQGECLSKGTSFAVNSGLRMWLDSFDDSLAYLPVLSWGSFATCGRRESMEDTHFLMPFLCNEKDVHAFGVFDGHRGSAAAEFSVQALPEFLKTFGSTCSPADALVEAFVKTDVAFRDELDSQRKSRRVIQKDWHPGCTAAAALIVRNKLFVAIAGDCRTILCRRGCPLALSRDHVASCPEERNRVISAGGEVKWQVDTWRVGRAALQACPYDDLKPAVTAEPEITETVLSAEDEFLAMASDGLWDVVGDTEVLTTIRDTVKEPAMCSKRLATEAVERRSKDNVIVIVVFLRPVSTAERVY